MPAMMGSEDWVQSSNMRARTTICVGSAAQLLSALWWEDFGVEVRQGWYGVGHGVNAARMVRPR